MKKIQPNHLLGRILFAIISQTRYLILAIGITIIGILLWYLPKAIEKASPNLPTLQVVVINSDLLAHTQIRESDVSVVPFIKGYVPLTAYEADKLPEVVGKYSVVPLKRGEVVTESLVSNTKDTSTGFSSTIRSNQKGFFLKSSDLHTSPEGIRTNDIIDIVAIQVDGSGAKSAPVRLLQKINVIDTRFAGDQAGLSLIGLSLSDDQISTLSTALANKMLLEVVIYPREVTTTIQPLTK